MAWRVRCGWSVRQREINAIYKYKRLSHPTHPQPTHIACNPPPPPPMSHGTAAQKSLSGAPSGPRRPRPPPPPAPAAPCACGPPPPRRRSAAGPLRTAPGAARVAGGFGPPGSGGRRLRMCVWDLVGIVFLGGRVGGGGVGDGGGVPRSMQQAAAGTRQHAPRALAAAAAAIRAVRCRLPLGLDTDGMLLLLCCYRRRWTDRRFPFFPCP